MRLHPCVVFIAEVRLRRHEVDPFIRFVDGVGDAVFVELRKELREAGAVLRHGVAVVIDRDLDLRLCEARTELVRGHDRAVRDGAERVDAVAVARVEVLDDVRQQAVQERLAAADMEKQDAVDGAEKRIDIALDLLPRADVELFRIGIEVQARGAAQVAGGARQERDAQEIDLVIFVDAVDGKELFDDEEIDVFLPSCLLELDDDVAALHLRDSQDDGGIFRLFHFGEADAGQPGDLSAMLRLVIVDESDEVELVLHRVREQTAVVAGTEQVVVPLLADMLVDMIELMPGMFPFHVAFLMTDAGCFRIRPRDRDGLRSFRHRDGIRAA